MAQEPATIREDIEQTRQRMDETIDALAYKADVKARLHDSVDGARSVVTGTADDLGARATGRIPGGERVPARVAGWILLGGGVVVAAGTAGAVVAGCVAAVRALRRPPDRFAVPVNGMPRPLRRRLLGPARKADRLLADAQETAGRRRDEAVSAFAEQIARAMVEEQERRNSLPRRVVREMVPAAATSAATLAVRRAFSGSRAA